MEGAGERGVGGSGPYLGKFLSEIVVAVALCFPSVANNRQSRQPNVKGSCPVWTVDLMYAYRRILPEYVYAPG